MAKQMLNLLDNLKSTGVCIEIDAETGISVTHDMGAFGSAPDMPRDIARIYLADQLGSLLAVSYTHLTLPTIYSV